MSAHTATETLRLGTGRRRTIAALVAAAVAAVALLAALAPGRAAAESPVYQFEVHPSTTQAGGHPNIDTLIWVGNRYTQHIPPPSCDCQDPRDILVEMPPGVIGDPHATPKCSVADFSTEHCPPETQVGAATISINAEPPGTSGFGVIAIYNLEPHPGEAGLIAFNFPLLHFPVFQGINSRSESDYGLDVATEYITHLLPLAFVEERLWGVPAAPANDAERLPAGWDSFLEGKAPPTPSNATEKPFLSNPTTCNQEGLAAHLTVTAYDKGVTHAETPFPPTTGCDQLSFNPSLYAQPTGTATDSPSGLDVDLQVPQQSSPKVPSPSEIRATTVTLPPGFTINPNAADGKTACSDEQALLGTRLEAQCPENSKVGTLSVNSSALPGPIPGYIYLGTPLPGDRYRLILSANGYNVHVKLVGSALADEQNGRVTVSFQNLPQTPFSDFNMHFFGSERGLLATPTQCGTYGVSSTFTPWDSLLPQQTSAQFFSLGSGPGGSGCPGRVRPFSPTLRAGVADRTAGEHSPFSITLNRRDGEQTLAGLDVKTPPGLSATLAGTSYCPDAILAAVAAAPYGLAELAAPSCPAGSHIGTSSTAAGAGDHPVHLPGAVYLAGPYKGAPLSLAVVTPAVSGPYDLGNVVVRAAIQVDPTSAELTAISDPLPQIVAGIPLRLREVLVNLDRPDFTLNPTNCDRFAVQTRVFGDQGAEADPSVPFQAANCSELPFGPKLALRLRGGTKRAQNPGLTTTLTAQPGEANITKAVVTMPPSLILDNSHIDTVCTKVQFAADACPAGSVMGTAKAVSPLLDKPLEGPVYLATGYGHKLPDVLAALKGQVDVNLNGVVSSKNGGLRTSFRTVPDVPVTKFTLSLSGGRRGLLLTSANNLCSQVRRATVEMTGQNNRRANSRPKVRLSCGKHSNRGRHADRGRNGHPVSARRNG
jgi:hypothetical protein